MSPAARTSSASTRPRRVVDRHRLGIERGARPGQHQLARLGHGDQRGRASTIFSSILRTGFRVRRRASRLGRVIQDARCRQVPPPSPGATRRRCADRRAAGPDRGSDQGLAAGAARARRRSTTRRGILAADLGPTGRALCDAVLRALADDPDLRRLEPGGRSVRWRRAWASWPGRGRRPPRAPRAVDALQRGDLGRPCAAELRHPDPSSCADLAERLALVCDRVLRAASACAGHGRSSPVEPVASPPAAARTRARAASPRARRRREPGLATGWRHSTALARAALGGALEDEIGPARGRPLSLLLAELEDADRVAGGRDRRRGARRRSALRRRGARRRCAARTSSCARPTPGRWIIARDTGRAGAQALGDPDRRGRAGAGRRWRGAPLSASVGAGGARRGRAHRAELIEAAEEARFAAAASGTGLAG